MFVTSSPHGALFFCFCFSLLFFQQRKVISFTVTEVVGDFAYWWISGIRTRELLNHGSANDDDGDKNTNKDNKVFYNNNHL